MTPPLGIQGLQQAQAANLRALMAVKPSGGLGRAVRVGAIELHRYAVAITHVDTGTLRASHRVQMTGAARAEIFIDPSAVNWQSKGRAAVYGVYEHERGGSHAFYDRTASERGQVAVNRAQAYLKREIS